MATIKFERCHSTEAREYTTLPPDHHRVLVFEPFTRENGTSYDKLVFVAEAKSKATLNRVLRAKGIK